MRLRLGVLVGLCLLGLSGCGSDGEVDRPVKAGEDPACAEVWIGNQRLPADYNGCVDGPWFVPAETQACSHNDGDLVLYKDAHFSYTAFLGGTIAASAITTGPGVLNFLNADC